MANHDKLRRLAERQHVAVAAMNQANAALNAKDYDTAGRQAEIVQREAPPPRRGTLSKPGQMFESHRPGRPFLF